jgi:hypothetical protein
MVALSPETQAVWDRLSPEAQARLTVAFEALAAYIDRDPDWLQKLSEFAETLLRLFAPFLVVQHPESHKPS